MMVPSVIARLSRAVLLVAAAAASSSLTRALGQDASQLMCTATGTKLVCPNADGTTRASFDLTGLQQLYPTITTIDASSGEWSYSLALFGQPAVPVDVDGTAYKCDTTTGNAAVFQYLAEELSADSECLIAGRFGSSLSTIQLLEASSLGLPALGPLGLQLNFTSGEAGTTADACGTTNRQLTVNLRCPYFLNGYAPNPVTPVAQNATASNPNPNPPAGLIASSPTRAPLVGQMGLVLKETCHYTVDIDSIFACPVACLPTAGIDLTTPTPAVVPSCGGNGICRDIRDEPATLGCLCNQDLDGERCEKASKKVLNSSTAQTPMAAVSIVLLCFVLLLTIALFRKLRYLNREDGLVYGKLDLQQSTAEGS